MQTEFAGLRRGAGAPLRGERALGRARRPGRPLYRVDPVVRPGPRGYYAAALRAAAVSTQEPIRCRIEWQGETREETIPAYLVAVCNGRWFGGGMDVAPMAEPDDGRLEVVVVASPTKPYLLRHIKNVYEGRHLDLPSVSHFSCDSIGLRLEDPEAERRFLLDVDGDALGRCPSP